MAHEIPLGRFVWFDLMTTDSGAAIDFYTNVLGWGIDVWSGGAVPYTMWVAGGKAIGGTMPITDAARRAGASTHWLPYLSTPNVRETVERATALGSTIVVAPQDIPTVGAFSVLRDPQGALFAAFTPTDAPPRGEEPAALGEFSWFELATHDVASALEFYAELFGWTRGTAMDMGAAGVYQLFEREGVPIGGMYALTAQMEMPPGWCCYVRVEDADEATARVAARGGKVLYGPMEIPSGDRVAACLDPQGGLFAVHALRAGGGA